MCAECVMLPEVGDRVRFEKKLDGGRRREWRTGVVLRVWMGVDEVVVDTLDGSFIPRWDTWEYVEADVPL